MQSQSGFGHVRVACLSTVAEGAHGCAAVMRCLTQRVTIVHHTQKHTVQPADFARRIAGLRPFGGGGRDRLVMRGAFQKYRCATCFTAGQIESDNICVESML